MFSEIKADLKARGAVIRAKKAQVKAAMRAGTYSGQWELQSLQWDYRHRHVAYSILRGRERNEVEKTCRRPLDEKMLAGFIEGYQMHIRIKKGELEKGAPEPKKLYVVVDDTLPQKYASVQAAHAVAEYMKHKQDFPNGTLVVLKAPPSYLGELTRRGWIQFSEPDLKGRLTAVSRFQEQDWLVKNLSLL